MATTYGIPCAKYKVGIHAQGERDLKVFSCFPSDTLLKMLGQLDLTPKMRVHLCKFS